MIEIFNSTVDLFNLNIGFLCFSIAVAQMFVRKKQPVNYVIIGIYFSYSFVIMSFSLEVSGKIQDHPHLIGLSWPFHVCLAAAVYLYIKTLIYRDFKLVPKHLLYFVPGLLYFLTLIPTVYLRSTDEKLIMLWGYHDFDVVSMLNLIFFGTSYLIFGVLCVYEIRFILNRDTLKSSKTFPIVLFILTCITSGVILNCVGLIMESNLIFRIDSIVFNFALLAPFCFSYRYPDFKYTLYH